MYKLIFALLCGCFFSFTAMAQQPDTLKTKNKTDSLNRHQDKLTSKPFKPSVTPRKEKTYHPDSTHLPHTAVMHSLMLPGWGQVYNHQIWKVPLIYAGLGALGYSIYYNHSLYISYERQAKALRNGEPGLSKYAGYSGGETTFENAANAQNRNFQLSILGLAAAWGINIIDAYIQAKFQHSYTMDNNFGLKITPGLVPPAVYASNNIGTFTPVLKLTFVLR